MQKIYIASDHAGYQLKEKIKDYFLNYQWEDLGCDSTDRVDFPDYANLLCESLKENNCFGILICGSGQGMAMRANKFPHIRAALCYNRDSTKLSRQHNDANIICLGERLISPELALELVKLFLTTDCEGGRHQERINKISEKV